MIIELVSGPNGLGICIGDYCIAGACGGGIMHTERKWRVRKDLLLKAVKESGYNMVDFDHVKRVSSLAGKSVKIEFGTAEEARAFASAIDGDMKNELWV